MDFQALAAEMAPNTRVNCVAPGFVPTHFAEFITGNANVVSSQNIWISICRQLTFDQVNSLFTRWCLYLEERT